MTTNQQHFRPATRQGPPRIIFSNQKGGVLKSTSTANAGMIACLAGKRALIVDLDPQGHQAYTFGYVADSLPYTLYDVLKGETAIENVVLPTFFDPRPGVKRFLNPLEDQSAIVDAGQQIIRGPDLIPLNIMASTADEDLVQYGTDEIPWSKLLYLKLAPLFPQYDYIFLDTNPGLGKLVVNGFGAATHVCIPLVPEYLPQIGLQHLLGSIQLAKESGVNPDLQIAGILFTRLRYKEHREMAGYLQREFFAPRGITCFQPTIKEAAPFVAASSQLSLIVLREPTSEHALAYWAFFIELAKKVNGVGVKEASQMLQALIKQATPVAKPANVSEGV